MLLMKNKTVLLLLGLCVLFLSACNDEDGYLKDVDTSKWEIMDAQISKVREVVLNLMEKDEGVCKDRPQSVNIDKLNPGRVRLQAKAWVTNKEYWDVRYRMLEAIKEELPKQGISLF